MLLERVADNIQRMDNEHGGGGLVSEIARRSLTWGVSLLPVKCPEPLRPQLLSAVARLGIVVGASQFDAYAHDDARNSFRLAAECAEEGGAGISAPRPIRSGPSGNLGGRPGHRPHRREGISSGEGQPEPPAARDDPDNEAVEGGAGEGASTDTSTDRHGIGASVVQNVPNNNGTVIAVQNVSEIHRLRGTPLPKKWIQSRLHCYVGDDDTAKTVASHLTTHRAVVIQARAGTGRYTTALHALTHQGVKTVRQVRREPNERVDLEGLKDEDTGWILDLRDEEETLKPGFGLHLREVEGHLRQTRSFIVVVTQPHTWTSVASEATELQHPLTPADALDVLREQLTHHEPPVDELKKWLGSGEITGHLTHATPAEAVRWARIISAAVDLNRSTIEPKPFDELVESVVQSARNWRRELLRMAHAQLRQRAPQLSVSRRRTRRRARRDHL
ncbi:hypothetical protein [Streptomyces sp. AcE210]|uniref:hypothetical protein n=1 Tax=Streptomyces sp. AcE210 TaxID=2292703 RepID=UPI001F0CCA76|nr:hypothetical protein [Streptomyces sp. AcE210]